MSNTPEEINRSHTDLLATLQVWGSSVEYLRLLSRYEYQDGWMLRECQHYYEELKKCSSMTGRFNQFYIEGKTADCEQWREDHEDCKVAAHITIFLHYSWQGPNPLSYPASDSITK